MEVTATGVETPVTQSPATVSVVSGQQIQDQVPGRIGDALLTVPGLYMSGSAFDGTFPSATSGQISLNGVSGPQRTILMIDGVPFNSPLGTDVDFSQLPTFGVDRIEVMPGPYSALYGSQALGGVINIITKEPTKREFEGEATLGDGSSETGKVNLAYRDVLSPQLAYALDFSYSGNTGFRDTPAIAYGGASGATTSVTGAIPVPGASGEYIVGDTGTTPSYQLKAGGRLYYTVDANTKFTLGLAYSESYLGHGAAPDSNLINPAGQRVYNGVVSLPNLDEIALTAPYSANPFLGTLPAGDQDLRAYATGQTKIGDVSIKSTLSYLYDRQWYDQGAGLANPIIIDPADLSNVPGSLISNPSYRVMYNLQAEKPITSWDALTVGFQYEHDQVTQKQQDLSDFLSPSSLSGATSNWGDGWTTTTSLYFQNKTDFLDKFHLYLGGREDWWSTAGSVSTAWTPNMPGNSLSTTGFPERSVASFSPKASLVYDATDALTLRVSAGRGFRTPDIYSLYSVSWTTPNPDLTPEMSKSWEAAAEWRPAARTSVTARYSENYLSNFIDFEYLSSPVYPYYVATNVNTEAATTRNATLAVDHRFNDDWSAFANFTRTWSRMDANPNDTGSVGKELTFTPDYMANLGVKYANGPWSVFADLRYVSKVYATEQNTDTATDLPTFYDPQLLVDAKVSYKFDDGVTASLSGRNLTNEHYYEYYLQPGRTVLASLSYKF